METEESKTGYYVGIAVIILLLLTSGLFIILNSGNKKNLLAEREITARLQGEKDQLVADLDRVNNDLKACRALNEELNEKIAQTQKVIEEKDRRIAGLQSQTKALAAARKEAEDLRMEIENLEKSLAELKAEHDKALKEIETLRGSVSTLEKEKEELLKQIQLAKTYDSDNFEIYGSRGKTTEKLTFRAFWTKKLNLNFDVPQSLTDQVSFKITTPSGNTLTPETAEITWKVQHSSRNYTASISPMSGEFEASRQVVLTYSPEGKFEKGEYRIQVFSNNINIGNCRVKFK